MSGCPPSASPTSATMPTAAGLADDNALASILEAACGILILFPLKNIDVAMTHLPLYTCFHVWPKIAKLIAAGDTP